MRNGTASTTTRIPSAGQHIPVSLPVTSRLCLQAGTSMPPSSPDGQPQHPGPAAPLSHCSLSSVQPWEGFCSCSGHGLTRPPPQAEPGLRVGCREDQGLQEGDGEVTQGENWSRGRGIAERATLPGLILVRIMEQLHHSSG